jgi:hypothetical protein
MSNQQNDTYNEAQQENLYDFLREIAVVLETTADFSRDGEVLSRYVQERFRETAKRARAFTEV